MSQPTATVVLTLTTQQVWRASQTRSDSAHTAARSLVAERFSHAVAKTSVTYDKHGDRDRKVHTLGMVRGRFTALCGRLNPSSTVELFEAKPSGVGLNDCKWCHLQTCDQL